MLSEVFRTNIKLIYIRYWARQQEKCSSISLYTYNKIFYLFGETMVHFYRIEYCPLTVQHVCMGKLLVKYLAHKHLQQHKALPPSNHVFFCQNGNCERG